MHSFKRLVLLLFVSLIAFMLPWSCIWNAQSNLTQTKGICEDQRHGGRDKNGRVNYNQAFSKNTNHDENLEEQRDDYTKPPPCGEICFYGGRERKDGMDYYQELTKTINCPNILGRMAWDKHEIAYPPPKKPPTELLEEFVQNGFMPLRRERYKVSFSPNAVKWEKVYSIQAITDLQHKETKGDSTTTYISGSLLSNILKKNSPYIMDKTGCVIGTRNPWVEATLLNYGAKKVATLEYANITLKHPKLSVYHPTLYAKKFLAGGIEPFDFGVSFSSVEHSGLGRYGDPLNPYGDLEAMAQAWCLIKPGGLFVLGIPCTKDWKEPSGYIEWNAHRVYGPARLSQITANWELHDVIRGNDIHAIFVLKRI